MKLEFNEFPKIARLSREIVITEKLDGTNASIFIQNEALEEKNMGFGAAFIEDLGITSV